MFLRSDTFQSRQATGLLAVGLPIRLYLSPDKQRCRRCLWSVVIALIVTPAGLALAYEVMAGNTSEKTTLRGFVDRIESLYGKARRVWLRSP
jgi:hypothetical protein